MAIHMTVEEALKYCKENELDINFRKANTFIKDHEGNQGRGRTFLEALEAYRRNFDQNK